MKEVESEEGSQLTIRKQAAIVFIPVRSVTVADPPRTSMVETMKFVESPKNKKTAWVKPPFHLQPRI